MKLFFYRLGQAFLFYSLFISLTFAATLAKSISFLTIADIHFDPFVGCASKVPCPLSEKLLESDVKNWPQLLSQMDKIQVGLGKDTNWPLLVSTLTTAKEVATREQVQFILLLGDFLGHEYHAKFKKYTSNTNRDAYQLFVKKTYKFLAMMLANAFPNTDTYALIGNNDSYHGDYYVESKGNFYQDFTATWGPLIKNNDRRRFMLDEMNKAGYYAQTIGEDLQLIILNTNLFSKDAKGKNISSATLQEWKWFESQLNIAKNQGRAVLIAMHIPEKLGLQVLSSKQMLILMTFWRPDCVSRFAAILKNNPNNIVGILAGHLHANWLQWAKFNDQTQIPVLISSSVSPIFGNRPGFRLYHYQPTVKKILDYTNFYLGNTSSWRNEKVCNLNYR